MGAYTTGGPANRGGNDSGSWAPGAQYVRFTLSADNTAAYKVPKNFVVGYGSIGKATAPIGIDIGTTPGANDILGDAVFSSGTGGISSWTNLSNIASTTVNGGPGFSAFTLSFTKNGGGSWGGVVVDIIIELIPINPSVV